MLTAMGPALQATGAALARSVPYVARYVGYSAMAAGVSYASWKFNKGVVDPVVEKYAGKFADWRERREYAAEARVRERRERWYQSDRFFEAELERRIKAGEFIRRRNAPKSPSASPSAGPSLEGEAVKETVDATSPPSEGTN
jgi:hypothetical protein